MYRDVESHFSDIPQVNIQRSIFHRPSDHKLSFNAGDLIPIYIDEVLPGDTFMMTSKKIVRLQTLLTPIMDNVYLDTYWFFVPNRLVWSHWKEFCGENSSGAWAPQTVYHIPRLGSPKSGSTRVPFNSGTLADYFGLPIGPTWSTEAPRAPSCLPFRAYALICNEFFRDENLTAPIQVSMSDNDIVGSNGDNYLNDVTKGGMPFKVAKYHDYFTSCLPAPLKGDPVSLPLDVTAGFAGWAEVFPRDQSTTYTKTYDTTDPTKTNALRYQVLTRAGESWATHFTGGNYPPPYFPGVGNSNRSVVLENPSSLTASGDNLLYPDNLWAYIPASSTQAGASVNINELRLAFALQRYLERNARGGSRYREILLSQFGVRSPDATMQIPEYLGGNRVPIQIHQVTNTAQSAQDFLGDLGAMSVTTDIHSDFQKSFTEHGYLIGLCCVRFDHTYTQGLERFWSRRSFEDFYVPAFANLGEVPVYKSEIYFDPSTNSDVFGYNEYGADYRYKPSRCSGLMRPGVTGSLASWHLADYYSESPTLSDAWIREDKTNLDRALAVTSSVSHQVFSDFYFDCKVVRPMPMYSVPGFLDHN